MDQRTTERRAARGDERALAEVLSRDMNLGKHAKRDVVAAATLGHPVAQRATGIGAFDDPYHALLAIEDSWSLADAILSCVRLVTPHLIAWAEAGGASRPGWVAFCNIGRFIARRDPLRWEDPTNDGKGDRGLVQDAIRRLVRRIRGDYDQPKPRVNAGIVLESLAMCCCATFHYGTEPERRAWIARECAEAAARIVSGSGEGMYDPREDDLVAVDGSAIPSSPVVPHVRFARFVRFGGGPGEIMSLALPSRPEQRLVVLDPLDPPRQKFSAWMPLACFKVEHGLCASSGVSRVMAEAILPGYVAAIR